MDTWRGPHEPKRALVVGLQVMRMLPESAALVPELRAMRVDVNEAGRTTIWYLRRAGLLGGQEGVRLLAGVV